MRKLAGWCYDRRRSVLAAWVVALIVVTALAQTVGGDLIKSFSPPATESGSAFKVLGKDFERKGDTGDLVWKVTQGTDVQAPAVKAAVTSVVQELAGLPHVVSVTSPYDGNPADARFTSSVAPIGHAEILFDVQANDVPIDEATQMRAIVAKANTDALQLELGGSMFTDQTQPSSEAIGILAAMVILLVAFGSFIAMGLPILVALIGIGLGIGFVTLLANVLEMPSFAPQVTLMIGIGVGIDYALFVVTRYRNGLTDGLEPRDAVQASLDTAGRSVLFAGCTVVISLVGLFVIGIGFIQGMATGAALAVLLVMAASVTLLPAMLGFAGNAIDKLSLPGAKKRREGTRAHEGSFWVRWSQTIQRRPWVFAIAGLVILMVLAIPMFQLRLGSADTGNDPTNKTTRRAYDLLSEGFGAGSNGPLLLVAEVKDGDTSALQQVANAAQAEGTAGGVAGVSPVIVSPNGAAALVQIQPVGSPQDESTTKLIHHLRDDVVPVAEQQGNADILVGGQTAVFADMADMLGARLPWFFVAVLTLSFLLLLVVFHSLLVPLKAVIMNLLSIGAAYGVIVAIFQWGWAKDVFGIGKAGPIESWFPMMLFAIVFGLSMDYEVFLLSRIKEDYDHQGDNAEAVSHGLAATARLITAAAAIMFCVFGSFVLSDQRVLKLLGVGLAAAVLIDATVVRLVLVPATMELLGDRNWWLPRWLGFLPKLDVEGHGVEGQGAERQGAEGHGPPVAAVD
jgi:putative drug exporter of the RND superfamily